MKTLLDRLHENIIVVFKDNGGHPVEPIEQNVLETFVSGKYDWKGLSPSKQKAMAVELLKARYLLQQQYNFMETLLDGPDDKRNDS